MHKKILLIGYNYPPELTGIGKYSGEMMEWLSKEGYECAVVTTYPYYPQWHVQEPYRAKRFWYSTEQKENVTVYRCPMYVPAEPTGKKRMLSDFSFFITALLKLLPLIFSKKFDYVITVAPSFQLGLLGDVYKRLKKAKHLYHIQDLQIEVAQELKMITSKKVLYVLYAVERYIFKRADLISSISERMVQKIEDKAKKEVALFPNWVDNTIFFPLDETHRLKSNYGYQATDKIILYSGAIGEKQGLVSILDAAETFLPVDGTHFIICGTGPYKKRLQLMAKEKQLTNLRFLPLQPRDKFNAFLNMADVHLVIQKTKASDLLLPSKLTAILAVGGLALITADKETNLHTVVDRYNMGILVPTENQKALEDGISRAFATLEASVIRNNARTYAEKFLSIELIMKTFQDSVLN